MTALRHFLLAVQFFTRIPVTGRLADWVGYSPEMLRASSAYFPLVGAVVGCVAAAVFAGVSTLMPLNAWTSAVAAVLSTVASVLLTGAFHEDGLADVADGLGGSYSRERALEIMKDSRVGAFGVYAAVLVMASKFSLLAWLGSVSLLQTCAALVLAHVSSRTASLLLIRAMPHVGDTANSKSKPLADQISLKSLSIAWLWQGLVMWALFQYLGWRSELLALGLCLLAALLMGRLFWRRLQGFTGDCLGATQQVCEIACYFGLALSL